MMDRNEQTLQILMEEYKVLKSEQNSRIGFRDNLLYVTLGILGTIASFALTNDKGFYAFLVIPWVCLIMGWTYLTNDDKISAIGRHIRDSLEARISALIGGSADNKALFPWETAHRSDPKRISRKSIQLFIDQLTFVLSGYAALIGFWMAVPKRWNTPMFLSIVEAILLLVLALRIDVYSDRKKGNEDLTSPK